MPTEKTPFFLNTKNAVPTRVKYASRILKISAWMALIGALGVILATCGSFIVPGMSSIIYYSLVLLSTFIGAVVGEKNHRHAMIMADELCKDMADAQTNLKTNNELLTIAKSECRETFDQITANKFLNTVEVKYESPLSDRQPPSSKAAFGRLTSSEVLVGTYSGLAGIALGLGGDIRARWLADETTTLPERLLLITVGTTVILAIAYGFMKAEQCVTHWETNINNNLNEANSKASKKISATYFINNELNREYRKNSQTWPLASSSSSSSAPSSSSSLNLSDNEQHTPPPGCLNINTLPGEIDEIKLDIDPPNSNNADIKMRCF